MSRAKKFYVTLGGGLGDAAYHYFNGDLGWGYIKALKENYYNVHIKAICSTHNPQTLELIKYNPYIDEMFDYGWTNNGEKIWQKYKGQHIKLQGNAITKNLKANKPKLYLSNEEHSLIKSLSEKPYVFIHPFAGEKCRASMPTEEYVSLIDKIIDTKKLNVVVVGGTYNRTNLVSKEFKQEVFKYNREGLFNLVNKSNVRILTKLAKESEYFIGSWSAYSCISWIFNKRTIVITQKNQIEKLKKRHSRGNRWHGKKLKIIKTEGPANNPKNTNYQKVTEQILKNLS